MSPSISVCIATYRRPERLAQLLGDLAAQTRPPQQIVVVDNDATGSAEATVRGFQAQLPCPLDYTVETTRGIAAARNRTVALATGEWLAFIDDDERAPPDWLERLLAAALEHGADGVLAPVEPIVPADAARWLQRHNYYRTARFATGTTVPLNDLRFGNLILRGTPLRAEEGPFDVNYGLVTGEDGDLLARMVAKGARIVWCNEAPVEEPVEPNRLSRNWLLQRAFSGGQEFARKTLIGRYGAITGLGKLHLAADVLLKLGVAALLSLATVVFGLHASMRWQIKLAANIGKLTAFFGMTYQEYRSASVSK